MSMEFPQEVWDTVREAVGRETGDYSTTVATAVLNALAPHIEKKVEQGRTEVLQEVQYKWQMGGWTTLTPLLPTIETRMAAAQGVSDWLRDRIDRGGTS